MKYLAILGALALAIAPATGLAQSAVTMGEGPHGYDFLIGTWSCVNPNPGPMTGPASTTMIGTAANAHNAIALHITGTGLDGSSFIAYNATFEGLVVPRSRRQRHGRDRNNEGDRREGHLDRERARSSLGEDDPVPRHVHAPGRRQVRRSERSQRRRRLEDRFHLHLHEVVARSARVTPSGGCRAPGSKAVAWEAGRRRESP